MFRPSNLLIGIKFCFFFLEIALMASKFSFREGASLNRPPLFCGENYQLWCIRMKFFVDSLDRKIRDVITNNVIIYLLENNVVLSENEKDHLDCVTKNIIVSALDSDELLKVSECISVKGMWDTLERIHRGSKSTWLDSDESSAGSSSTDFKMDVCLMAREESASNHVSAPSSTKCDGYYQLLEAIKETRDEANRLTLSNNRLKSKNNQLKERVRVLEEDLNNSKTDFENLEMLYQNSSCKCESSSCKNCDSLQKKVLYLVKTVDTISKCKSNLKNVLASQWCVFGKSGNPKSKNSGCLKPFSTITKNQPIKRLKQPVVCCFYCMRKGHSVRFCKIRNFFVPKVGSQES